MNKLIITGNLVRDPEMRSTSTGKDVCSFTVAVNRKRKVQGQPDADFFRVSAWEERGRLCQKYLAKGRKVAVTGPVSVSTYKSKDGETKANLEVMAEEIEFLSPKDSGYERVEPDDNPFTQPVQQQMDELPWA